MANVVHSAPYGSVAVLGSVTVRGAVVLVSLDGSALTGGGLPVGPRSTIHQPKGPNGSLTLPFEGRASSTRSVSVAAMVIRTWKRAALAGTSECPAAAAGPHIAERSSNIARTSIGNESVASVAIHCSTAWWDRPET